MNPREARYRFSWLLRMTTAICVVGGAFVGHATAGAVLLNEFYINPPPPDADAPREYVELIDTTGSASLSGKWLIGIEGDAPSNPGKVLNAVNLSGLSFGTNGILILGEDYDTSNPWGITDPPTKLADLNGTLQNGSTTFMLVDSFTGSVDDDLDTNDDGALDSTPWSGIWDSIAWTDNGAGDRTYAPMAGNGLGFAPDAISRIDGNTSASDAAAWFGGDMAASADPLSTEYSATLNFNLDNAGFPIGTNPAITPGVQNIPEPSGLALASLSVLGLFFARRRRRA